MISPPAATSQRLGGMAGLDTSSGSSGREDPERTPQFFVSEGLGEEEECNTESPGFVEMQKQ